jgi:hypothetical protein
MRKNGQEGSAAVDRTRLGRLSQPRFAGTVALTLATIGMMRTHSIGRGAKRAMKCRAFSVTGIGDGRNGRGSSKNEREKQKGSKTEPSWFPKASNESPNQSSQLIEPGDRPWSAGNSGAD